MRFQKLIVIFVALFVVSAYAQDSETFASEEEYIAWAGALWDSLDRQTGPIALPGVGATIDVPDDYYLLNAQDAQKVLVDVWGNPPDESTLGMIFQADSTPFDRDAWGVTIEYEEDGYVSDKDASDIDYGDLLVQMKKDTQSYNKERIRQGYEGIELVGWAAAPFYDEVTKKLYWAKEIRFGQQEVNTLNYNIRVLGRKGVLLLNFIAGIDQKETIESNLDSVLAMAEFDQGSTYADFNPDLDTVAAYGVGALVAGKVLAKAGFFAVALVFLKKFGILIIIGLGAILKRLFSRKQA